MGGGALSSKNVSELGSKEVSKICHLERSESSQSYEILRLAPQNDKIFTLAPWRRADLRTDVAKRVRIASRLSTLLQCNMCEILGAWSKFKTEAVVCEAKRALQMQERGISSCNNKTLSRISKFTAFTKKFNPLPEVEGRVGFTLAEVLITLGVIGVVAVLTLPSVINNINNKHYKTAYKKAYSDLSQVVARALDNNELAEQQSSQIDLVAGEQNYNVIKSYFRVTKECEPRKIYDCWVRSDDNWGGYPTNSSSRAFVDSSGRVWAQKSKGASVYFVDVNGNKGPNIFGKDRFTFVFADGKGDMLQIGLPSKVIAGYEDVVQKEPHYYCKKPPCYYHSWLYED